MKLCNRCDIEKPLSDFHKNKSSPDGLHSICAKCKNAQTKARYEPVKVKNYSRGLRHHNYKHGMKGTRIYKVWTSMKERCLNPRHHAYSNYGGRGIKICSSWLDSFSAFYADMGDIPEGDYSIDRRNNSKDYSPDNCRWATRSEQAINRRTRSEVEYDNAIQA